MNRKGQILGRGITLFAVILVVFLIIVGFLAMTFFISMGKSSKEIFEVSSIDYSNLLLDFVFEYILVTIGFATDSISFCFSLRVSISASSLLDNQDNSSSIFFIN